MSDRESLYRLGKIAYEADAPETVMDGATIERYWEAVALAVAREVLGDPARWARELGLPETPTVAVSGPVVAQDDGGGDVRHPWLTWTRTRY